MQANFSVSKPTQNAENLHYNSNIYLKSAILFFKCVLEAGIKFMQDCKQYEFGKTY